MAVIKKKWEGKHISMEVDTQYRQTVNTHDKKTTRRWNVGSLGDRALEKDVTGWDLI